MRDLRKADLVRIGLLAAIFFVVIGAGVAFSIYGFSFILRLPAMGELVLSSLVDLLFFILFHLLAISNLLLGYAYLFRTKRAHLNFGVPVPAHAVFLLRLGGAFFQSSWATFLLVGAVLVSYGVSLKAPTLYYLAVPVVLGSFLALCGAIGLSLSVVLGYLRTRLGRRVFTVGGALLLAAGVIYLAAQVGTLSFKPGEELIFLTRLTHRLGAMHSPYWPGKWASNAVNAFANGLGREGWFAVALLASTACVFWPALDLSGRFFYLTLWQEVSAASGGRKIRRDKVPRLTHPVAAIIRKDILLFLRDPAQSLQLVLFLLLMGLYSLSLLRFPRGVLPESYMRYVATANIAAMSFILGSFSSRFVYPLLGTEGLSIWVLASAPQGPETILRAKLFLGYLFMLPAAVALSFSSHSALGLSRADALAGTGFLFCLAQALTGLALAFSATFAEFTSDRPGEVLGTMGGTANFLTSSGFVVVAVGLWALGAAAGRNTLPGAVATVSAVGLSLAVAAGGYFWALRAYGAREF